MNKDKRINRIIGIVLLGICGFLAAVSVYLCFSRDIWYDELFTVGLAGCSFADLTAIATRDVHPPLYYFIVKIILDGCGRIVGPVDPVIGAKMVSVLPFILLLVYSAVKVRKHFGLLTAGIFSFLVFTMPQLSAYTVEIRMYSYSLFFITAAMLHAYELVVSKSPRQSAGTWILFTLYALGAAYTHYFAFAAAAMIYVFLFIWVFFLNKSKKMRITWCISAGAAALGYLPWLAAVLQQVGQVKASYWIQPLTWRSIGGCIKYLFKPAFTNDTLNTVLAMVLFLLFVITIFLRLWQNHVSAKTQEVSQRPDGSEVNLAAAPDRAAAARSENLFLIASLGVMAGLILFGFAASFLIRPVFIYRYMLPAMGVFWLCFAICLGRLGKEKSWFYPILFLLVIVGLGDYRAFYGEEMWKRVQMETTVQGLSEIKAEDIIIFNFNHTQGVVSYYLPNETFLYQDEPEELVRKMFPQVQGMGGVDEIRQWLTEGKQVWFFGSGNAREEIRSQWADEGITAEEKGSFLIERYWFNIYYLSS